MYKLLSILFFILPLSIFGQIKRTGTPQIHNYSKSEYNAGTQNWAIAQDDKGFMYFANNDGVLRFDGLHWDLFKIKPSSPVRTVFIDSKNRIFVGLLNDFGMLQPDQTGKYKFQSLKHLLPNPDMEFEEIWKIHEISEGIVFQSFDFMFILNDNQVKVIQPKKQFHFSFNVNGRLFLQEPGMGLFEYKNGAVSRLPWDDELVDKDIWSMLAVDKDKILIGTDRFGIYLLENGTLKKWNTPASEMVKEYKLFSAAPVTGDNFAFGTITGGIVICNSDGEILQHINRIEGLQNSTVLSLYPDRNKNLWLGLDNGIDYMEINSPVSYISTHKGLGAGYAAQIFNNKLYLGTNQGLFVKPFSDFTGKDENFQFIENTTGQVWSLEVFDNQLICGHNFGTFLIRDGQATQISDEQGAWKFIRLRQHPESLLGGHYNGLQLLKKENGRWQFANKLKGFDESSRHLVQDENGRIWMSHEAKGVFKIRLNNKLDSVLNYKLYTSKQGLPSDEMNIIFNFKNSMFVSTTNGIYRYNSSQDRFQISEELTRFFDFQGQLKTLKTDSEGNIWFVTENESGVFRLNEDLTYTKITSPFKELDDKYISAFEYIYPFNNTNVFLGIDNGFAHYSSNYPKSYTQPFRSYITRIEIPYLDSVLFLNRNSAEQDYEFPFKKNSFRFHYAAPFYENQEQLQFSYFLENYSEDWSEWSSIGFKEFINLYEGDYTFKLKTKNVYGTESEISEFSFSIEPPWYRSVAAYYSYVILFAGLVILFFRLFLYRMKIIRAREISKHRVELQAKEERFQRQSLEAEREIVKLRNERLVDEMLFRDKELANQTMAIIQKNRFLVKLKEELQRLENIPGNEKLIKKLTSINKKIDKEIDDKKQNQVFETYFDEVHNEFFERLKEKYPQLSPREMRLCAFIRMNLTSKEIAALSNITDRGVEVSRYRLRKKLGLERDINLSVFLSNI